MFAIFGEIVFDVLDSPAGYESRRDFWYAEQRVLQARPRLQWIADGLAEIELEVRLHSSFTNPDLQLLALEAAAADHLARPLVFGNGNFRGFYILVSLAFAARQMSAVGDLIAATARLGLREWDFNPALGGVPLPGALPVLGAVNAPTGYPTAPVAYTAAGGVASALAAPTAPYSAAPIAAPGVSPVVSLPIPAGASAPRLTANDVPASQIVRAPY